MDCVYCSYVPPSSPPATSAAPRIHSVPQACNSACLGCCLLSLFSRILPRAWGRVGLHTWQGQAIVPGEWDGTLVPSSCPALSGWSWPGREPVEGQSQGDLWQQSRSKPKRGRAARGQSPSSHPVAKAPSGTWAAWTVPHPQALQDLGLVLWPFHCPLSHLPSGPGISFRDPFPGPVPPVPSPGLASARQFCASTDQPPRGSAGPGGVGQALPWQEWSLQSSSSPVPPWLVIRSLGRLPGEGATGAVCAIERKQGGAGILAGEAGGGGRSGRGQRRGSPWGCGRVPGAAQPLGPLQGGPPRGRGVLGAKGRCAVSAQGVPSPLPFVSALPGQPLLGGAEPLAGEALDQGGGQLVGDEGVGGRGDVGHGVGSVSAERPGRRAEVSGSQRERAPKRLPCLHVCLCYRRSLQPKHKPPKSSRTFPIILPPEEAWLTMPMARGARRPAVP